jgi:NadR type nicotinamide-nucleotide adenylyltransferase
VTLGLVIGKFYPPHRGHKHLIDTASAQCDHLIVIICDHVSQVVPGERRLEWFREIHPGADIRVVPDELENDSKQWADWTVNYLGRAPDVVFTSEDYGPVYARLMGSRHVMVDQSRITVPVSGTAVRADPLAMLPLVEPCVRSFLVPRVVVVGAESTGKTTLTEKLAAHFQTSWVPEYGREHWERKIAKWDIAIRPSWTADEFLHIAIEQQRRENLAARSSPGPLFCDTNATATGTWFERYMNCRSPEVDAIGSRDVVDLYLLTAVDVPFVQDGFRDGEHIRHWMHRRFRETLGGGAVRVVEISGDWSQRFATAERATRNFLGKFRRF